ncbi:secreted acidic protein 2-like [Penaeus indicus]|uniref:secreted acidic protein 2-like n=1 Tax=Penaeus indicus TaxID=29960 RepID=UPI00300D1E99
MRALVLVMVLAILLGSTTGWEVFDSASQVGASDHNIVKREGKGTGYDDDVTSPSRDDDDDDYYYDDDQNYSDDDGDGDEGDDYSGEYVTDTNDNDD